MAPRRVRLREGLYAEELEIDGTGVIAHNETGDGFVCPIEVVGAAGLTSLRDALVKYAGTTSEPPRRFVHPETGEEFYIPREPPIWRAAVELVDVPQSKFVQKHTYEFLPEPVDIVLREGGKLAVRVQFVVEGETEPEPELLKSILEPLLKRSRARVDYFDCTPQGPADFRTSTVVTSADFWVVTVYVSVPTHGRDVDSAIAIGRDVLAILEAAEHGRLSPASAQSLVEADRADLLIGQAEGSWLDCKAEPYQDNEYGRFELAKDVSAFANSPAGGLIVIGLRTRSRAGEDVITARRPVPTDEALPERYRAWIRHRIFPRPVDIEVKNIRHTSRTSTVLIAIPPQPRALRPFLVRGILTEGKLLGSHLAVFGRRGDAVIGTEAEELHSLLVAGRAVLGYDSSAE